MPLAREIVLPIGIEHRIGRRQRVVGLVVIDDDDFGAGRIGGGDGGLRGGAAIDGEDQARAVFRKADQRLRRRAVAFGEPVGDIGRHALPMGAQEALDQRDRGRTVDIVIAEHGDLLAGLDGGGKARGRLLHVPEAATGRAAAS